MRSLHKQLIDLFNESRRQQNLEPLPKQLAVALEEDFYGLLLEPSGRHVAIRWRLVSHAHLHRHVVSIRCPDQAFYLDAIKGYFLRCNIQPLEQQMMVARVECDKTGCTLAIHHPARNEHDNLMFIALHISATLVPDGAGLIRDLKAILQAVALSVRDFTAMLDATGHCADRLQDTLPEAAELLRWMCNDKYLFFGMQVKNRRLGLLKNYRILEHVAKGLKDELAGLSPPDAPGAEWLHLAASQHYTYSMASLEIVRIAWNNGGTLASAIVLGHFSRSARHMNSSQTPLLCQRWQQLMAFPLLTHSAFYMREIRTLFDRLPKPLLLSLPESQLLAPLKAIIDLTGPAQTHTTVLAPRPGNVHILMSAIPVDRFGPNVLANIIRRLQQEGLVTHAHLSFGVGPHRLLLLTCTCKTLPPEARLAEIIQKNVTFWKDAARREILQNAEHVAVPQALADIEQIPLLYQELFPPDQFLVDMQARDQVLANQRTRVHIHEYDGHVELHIFTLSSLPLGKLVVTVQNLGLTALQEAVVDLESGGKCVHLISIRCTAGRPLQATTGAGRISAGLEQVLNGLADDDAANSLMLSACLDIEHVMVLIALRNHLIQLLPDAAPLALTRMLNCYPQVSSSLYGMFAARHGPEASTGHEAQARLGFEEAMTKVLSLTDDRWFRALAELVQASLRSNAYVRQPGAPVSIKIAPERLSFAPWPQPFREIFVHGVHVEGVHLRAGPIARGGIRYSDRPADFRTEVLELMATQVEKNGQIVPTGAKGGFVTQGGSGPEFIQKQYCTFIRALLELSDNRGRSPAVRKGKIRIQAEDKDDSYLVVAADKGTASFSDLANAEAKAAGFWLDDAFASGGRNGYDHKAIGITARGAWVCVAEHFSATGINACTDPVSVIGIGDMSGDVFGNGMLLNPNLRLLAAFNHRHIFIDPHPDTEKAFVERKRLFRVRGGWDQYNKKLISRGGGIYARTAKSIPVSVRMQKILDISVGRLNGEALIQALLCAPVDLLYNGGIGTYVKASGEGQAEARDPANISVRVNASQLRCKVVGEGGNLGFTQKARIEFAARGGLINTDAIDNSAAVDMSDHEVNLKIMLASAAPPLARPARNKLLQSLTSTVTGQCLSNNLNQSRCLELAGHEARKFQYRFDRLRDTLIAESRLAPGQDAEMTGKAGDDRWLRPRLAVLLGHEKNRVHAGLVNSNFAGASPFRQQLACEYFPPRLHKRFARAIAENPLADEIIATVATNRVLNHMGLTRVHLLQELLDTPAENVVHALLMADALLETESLRQAIWQQVSDRQQAEEMLRQVQELVSRFAEHLLRLCPVHRLDLSWMQKHRRHLHGFRSSQEAEGAHQDTQTRFRRMLSEAETAGLGDAPARHFAALPELAFMGVAVHLSARYAPLRQCLRACQAAMQLLPFSDADWLLRMPDWGKDTEYELRKEWLHRLTRLAERATRILLQASARHPAPVGYSLWSRHRHWEQIQQLHKELKQNESRMTLILLMTLIENLIDETEIR